MKDFFLNVFKKKDSYCTSITNYLKKFLGRKTKVGYSGILDPFAEGILVIGVGKACKLFRFLEDYKIYNATIRLGIETDTFDKTGQVISQQEVNANEEIIKETIVKFIGEQVQEVPIFSAAHINGTRLYKLARKSINIQNVPKKKIHIYKIEFVKYEILSDKTALLSLIIHCKGGTYVRTLARDIGRAIGCGGHLYALTRTYDGGFHINTSIPIEEIKNKEDIFAHRIPIEKVIKEHIVINPGKFNALKNGIKIKNDNISGVVLFKSMQGEPLIVARLFNGEIKDSVFLV